MVGATLVVVASRSIFIRLTELESRQRGLLSVRHVIEYKPDGTILWANELFLKLLGYRLDDIVGRNHSIFVDPEYAKSGDYREFWARLGRGEFIEQRFQRKAAGGRDIWVLTNYIPEFDSRGKLVKVVNYMTDLTAAHMEQAVVIGILAGGLKRLAAGDLTTQIRTALEGEYDQLRKDFDTAAKQLQETVQAVLRSANSITAGAGEISQAADDLSRRTEQQAASLEETAAALEEITATVKKTAANTREATSTMAGAKAAAEEGTQIVGTAIRAMDSISQSSNQITDIIGVIDEIAFQTNLLALNAGVEAARAGDAGKGFAVVASEVRALAGRSSEAAKQIKTLILTSRQHVESGVKYVGDTGAALGHILESVESISTLITEMAQAAEQEATGIEQVNAAVGQMDQVTQQNAAMVEESTAASKSLADETRSLAELVSFFNVGTSGPVSPRESHASASTKPSAQPPRRSPKSASRGQALAPARKATLAKDEWEEF
jgi:methyl-accepting chemotaxis protein